MSRLRPIVQNCDGGGQQVRPRSWQIRGAPNYKLVI